MGGLGQPPSQLQRPRLAVNRDRQRSRPPGVVRQHLPPERWLPEVWAGGHPPGRPR